MAQQANQYFYRPIDYCCTINTAAATFMFPNATSQSTIQIRHNNTQNKVRLITQPSQAQIDICVQRKDNNEIVDRTSGALIFSSGASSYGWEPTSNDASVYSKVVRGGVIHYIHNDTFKEAVANAIRCDDTLYAISSGGSASLTSVTRHMDFYIFANSRRTTTDSAANKYKGDYTGVLVENTSGGSDWINAPFRLSLIQTGGTLTPMLMSSGDSSGYIYNASGGTWQFKVSAFDFADKKYYDLLSGAKVAFAGSKLAQSAYNLAFSLQETALSGGAAIVQSDWEHVSTWASSWNDSQSTLETHLQNSGAHVTTADKTKWNNASTTATNAYNMASAAIRTPNWNNASNIFDEFQSAMKNSGAYMITKPGWYHLTVGAIEVDYRAVGIRVGGSGGSIYPLHGIYANWHIPDFLPLESGCEYVFLNITNAPGSVMTRTIASACSRYCYYIPYKS